MRLWHNILYQNPAVSIKEVSFTFRGTADMREHKFLIDAFGLAFKRLWLKSFYCPAQTYALSTVFSLAISPVQASMYKQKDSIKKQLFSPVILLQTIMPASISQVTQTFLDHYISFNFLVIIRNIPLMQRTVSVENSWILKETITR